MRLAPRRKAPAARDHSQEHNRKTRKGCPHNTRSQPQGPPHPTLPKAPDGSARPSAKWRTAGEYVSSTTLSVARNASMSTNSPSGSFLSLLLSGICAPEAFRIQNFRARYVRDYDRVHRSAWSPALRQSPIYPGDRLDGNRTRAAPQSIRASSSVVLRSGFCGWRSRNRAALRIAPRSGKAVPRRSAPRLRRSDRSPPGRHHESARAGCAQRP